MTVAYIIELEIKKKDFFPISYSKQTQIRTLNTSKNSNAICYEKPHVMNALFSWQGQRAGIFYIFKKNL